MIAVEVVRPASLELAAKEIALTPGATAELRGKVSRVAPFAEEVVVKLEGLPAGSRPSPSEVAADVAEFTLTLKVADDAAPAEARANAVVAFKLGGKDYSVAPGPLALKVARQGMSPPRRSRGGSRLRPAAA